MAQSGTLRVRIVGDDGPLRRTLSSTRGAIGGFAKGIAKVGAAGAAAAAGGLLAATNATAAYGDRVAKTSRTVGLSVEAFQELEFALGQLGLNAEESEAVLLQFNKRIGEAADGGGAAAETVDKLGLQLRDANGQMRDQDDILTDAIRALEGLESSQERAAAAADLFGDRQGPKLASAIEAGADGIDDLRQKARDLGIVMDEDSAEASERFNDALDDLKKGLGGAVRSLTAEFIPVLADKVVPAITQKVIPAVRQFFRWLGPRLDRLMTAARRIVERWWPVVVDAFETISEVVGDVVDVISGLFDDFQQALGDNEGRIRDFVDQGRSLLGRLQETFRSAWEAISTIVQTAVSIIREFWDRFGRHIIDFTVRTFGRWQRVIGEAFDIVTGIFDAVTALLRGDWEEFWAALRSIVESAWGIIQNVVTQAFDILKTAFGGAVAVISQIWDGLWDGLKVVATGAANVIIGIFEGIIQTFRNVLQWIRNVLQGLRNVADFVGVDVPDLPDIPNVELPRLGRPTTGSREDFINNPTLPRDDQRTRQAASTTNVNVTLVNPQPQPADAMTADALRVANLLAHGAA